jgi:hypothetical protein
LAANRWAQDIHGIIGVHELGHDPLAHDLANRPILGQQQTHHASGEYTGKSAYLASFHGSTNSASRKHI